MALVLGAVAAAAGCGAPASGNAAAQPASRSDRVAAVLWPTTPKEDLLFPALRQPVDHLRASDRCVTAPGAEAPPDWLREAVATSSCGGGLKVRVETAAAAAPRDSSTALQALLTAAAICDDVGSLRRAVAAGADVNGRDTCGSTALVAAAAAGSERAAAELLGAHANPDLPSDQGPWSRPPLLAALARGNHAIAQSLLDARAATGVETPGRRTALMLAAMGGDSIVTGELLRHGADPCKRDATGLSAFVIARARGVADVIKLLKGPSLKCANPPNEALAIQHKSERGGGRGRKARAR